MSHIQAENFALNASNDKFSALWKLTRLMKHAGWRYKASADGSALKDTTGNPNSDIWGGGGTVQGPTTVAFTIGTPNSTAFGGRVTLTGLASMATTSVGHFLKITGATNSANNGTWLITKFLSASSVQIENPAAVAETTPGSATYTELSALTDTYPPAGIAGSGAWLILQGPSTMRVPIGTVGYSAPTFIKGEKVTQATSGAEGEVLGVYIDQVNGGFLVISPRVSGTGGDPRGWDHTHTITGAVSGATATPTATVIEYVREVVFWYNDIHTGHIFYQCVDSVNESTPTVVNTTIAAGSNGATLPQATIFLASTAGLPASGSISITTGSRKETITYASIAGNTLQGCQGGATAMATGQVAAYSIGRFSAMAGGASATQPPGGQGSADTTTNGFPVIGSFAVLGTVSSGTAATGSQEWNAYTISAGAAKAQLFAMNCIEDAGISADGSFTMAIGQALTGNGNTNITVGSNGLSLPQGVINATTPNATGFPSSGTILVTTAAGPQVVKYTGTSATQFTGCTGGTGLMSTGGLVTAGFFSLMGFLRLDDIDDGELEPFVWGVTNHPSSTFNRNRTGTGTSTGTSATADQGGLTVWIASSSFIGWRHRGLGSTSTYADTFTEYVGMLVGFTNAAAAATNAAAPDLVACTPATVTVREPFFLITFLSGTLQQAKSRKGSTRWWNVVLGNSSTDMYDTKSWIQLSSATTNLVVGPGDGTTVPANQ